MSTGIIIEHLDSQIVRLTLDRPERMNALGSEMTQALIAAVEELAGTDTRVLLITGEGRSFCAGADLKERKGMDHDQRIAHNRAINGAINAVAALPFVTVAVVNGAALGGGCELMLACDMRLAAASATMGLTESRIGAFPGAGGTQRLPRLIGAAPALEMMFTADPVSAERAERLGLVNEVVAPERLQERSLELARHLASRSPAAQRAIKRLVYGGVELPLAEGLAKERAELSAIFSSADYAEGLAAFAEKRSPRFS
ncbi:enoyl-CoA hydratase [Agaricicola taiwanensis]|uniref:Enoyl-CoA hydratase n=1 Tax=Agaricicola taiwanensis TaxID=591372 RepID=A0A8J2YIF5_9RHOB|nr:enoyl-CoA hydratase-related protein [Agaricicola taiwanensis]GGE45550.1 enoyl-CoA hydratase [Agaricicola taiwanensis]